jgi:hypothetical protein
MGEKTGEKTGKKRGEDKWELVIYRIRSPRQNAEDDVKHLEDRKGPTHEDRQTKITVWELAYSGSRFGIPGREKGAFSDPSLKVDNV